MKITELLEEMDYKHVLRYFAEISAVPRGSGYNEKISAYLVAFAKEHGLRVVQDAAYNVMLYKPATPGYEAVPPILIQGHMDMVCVAEAGVSHEFHTEGLSLAAKDGYLYAEGTTLGADDGIALAIGMALLTDEALAAPALEVLFTTDEETGMDGAHAFDPAVFNSKAAYLLNLDSEQEGVIWCSCAGGLRLDGQLPVRRERRQGTLLSVSVSGLLGGHSGTEIHKHRTNAVRLLARALYELRETCAFSLVSMSGGEKDNAIPNAAKAELLAEETTELFAAVERFNQIAQKESELEEPELLLSAQVSAAAVEAACLDAASLDTLLFVLLTAPDGVQGMSAAIDGLVETSLNLGIFSLNEAEAELHYSLRGSVKSRLHFLRDRLSLLLQKAGVRVQCHSEYPAWQYAKESKLRTLTAAVYEELFGQKAELAAVHAGLECGILGEKLPRLDMISIGPTILDIHTPKERLELASALRLYRLLERILAKSTELL